MRTPYRGEYIPNVEALPPASADYRGMQLRVPGASGTEDVAAVCVKADDGTYSWKELQGGGVPSGGTAGQVLVSDGSSPSWQVHRAHGGITVAAADSPAWMQRIADYVCDGTADDVEWQAAIDEAEDYANAQGIGRPDVVFLPGTYFLSATVTRKGARMLGMGGPSYNVRVYWTGAAGDGPVIASGVSNVAGEIAGFGFRGANNEVAGLGGVEPGTWIDLTNDQIDAAFHLHHLYFSGGDYHIKTAGWYNLFWDYLRFDHWREYAIQMVPHAGQYFSNAIIRNFTADHTHSSGAVAKGFLHIDATDATVAVGSITLESARIEVNTAWDTPQALVHVTHSVTTPARVVDIRMNAIDYQDAIGMANDVALVITATAPTSDSLTMTNFRPSGLSAYIGGDWLTSAPEIPVASYGVLSINNQTGGNPDMVANHLRAQTFATSGHMGYTLRRGAETENRWGVDSNGTMVWGSGSAATDINLYRGGANILKTDDKLVTTAGIGVGNSAAATTPGTVTRKVEIFDASGASLGFVPVYDAIT